MKTLRRNTGVWARTGLLLVGGIAVDVARTDPGSGYLSSTNLPVPALRFANPPLPAIAPLPPLPPTYIPTPKFSAEFMAELRATAAPQRSNLVGHATAAPSRPADPVAPGPALAPPAVVTVPVGEAGELISHFLSGNPGTNGPSGPTLLFQLPIPTETSVSPSAGTSRSTYESR